MIEAIQKPTPNESVRNRLVSAIILHCDASRSEDATIGWILNPVSRVSYHYLIGRDGKVYQFVREPRKAWHAGKSEFQGETDCNQFAVGLAFSNRNNGEVYTPTALATMQQLVREVMDRHPLITMDRITTHALVSPGRKTDPTPPFDLASFLEGL